MIKKVTAFILAVVMLISFTACGNKNTPAEPVPETKQFTDSVGREVEVPANIEKVALSGPLAQIVCFALCPDKLVGISTAWANEARKYLADEYYNMPVIGQLYGGKGELNLEELLDSGAQIVIDIGEPKGSIAEDMDALQKQTGIPFVHISAFTASMDETYIMLGELLGMEDEAAKIADYCRNTYERAVKISNSVKKKNLLYILMDGQNVIAKGSYHAEAIDMFCNNIADICEPSSKGTGNEVDMEQILSWNPDYILFAPDSVYSKVADDPAWQSINAIKNGNYYEVPFGPYNWMGFPPSVQRYLGILWMPYVLYPEACDYDLYDEVKKYYSIFYHCDLTENMFKELTANSVY